MHIALCARGRMGNAFKQHVKPPHNLSMFNGVGAITKQDEVVIGVNFSKNHLPLFIEWCNRHNVPIIHGMTDVADLGEAQVPVIVAPNLSVIILRTIKALPTWEGIINRGDMRVTLMEVHQPNKTALPGTAQTMAKTVSIADDDIISIRNRMLSLALGVPPAYIDGHAIHCIRWEEINDDDSGASVEVTTTVFGRRTYVDGTIALANAILRVRSQLKPGVHHIKDSETMELLGWP